MEMYQQWTCPLCIIGQQVRTRVRTIVKILEASGPFWTRIWLTIIIINNLLKWFYWRSLMMSEDRFWTTSTHSSAHLWPPWTTQWTNWYSLNCIRSYSTDLLHISALDHHSHNPLAVPTPPTTVGPWLNHCHLYMTPVADVICLPWAAGWQSFAVLLQFTVVWHYKVHLYKTAMHPELNWWQDSTGLITLIQRWQSYNGFLSCSESQDRCLSSYIRFSCIINLNPCHLPLQHFPPTHFYLPVPEIRDYMAKFSKNRFSNSAPTTRHIIHNTFLLEIYTRWLTTYLYRLVFVFWPPCTQCTQFITKQMHYWLTHFSRIQPSLLSIKTKIANFNIKSKLWTIQRILWSLSPQPAVSWNRHLLGSVTTCFSGSTLLPVCPFGLTPPAHKPCAGTQPEHCSILQWCYTSSKTRRKMWTRQKRNSDQHSNRQKEEETIQFRWGCQIRNSTESCRMRCATYCIAVAIIIMFTVWILMLIVISGSNKLVSSMQVTNVVIDCTWTK